MRYKTKELKFYYEIVGKGSKKTHQVWKSFIIAGYWEVILMFNILSRSVYSLYKDLVLVF